MADFPPLLAAGLPAEVLAEAGRCEEGGAGGDQVLRYTRRLTDVARKLRASMTESERKLWRHLRGRQVRNVRFYRQRPVGDYIVDFYAPTPKLVVEVNGGQHYDEPGIERDAVRDAFLMDQGLEVLRFSNRDVLESTEGVVEAIRIAVERRLQD